MLKEKTIEIPIEFRRLFDKDWREAAIYGGRFSLKSHSVARILLIRAREKNIRVACFREFQSSIADSSYQLLSDLIKLYRLDEFELKNNSIINSITGSDFIFKGLWNNEQSIKSTEGIDVAWVEEAQTVSEKSLEILTPTVRKDGSQIIYTYNRLLEEDPVHKRLVIEGRPNTLIINVNYDIALKYGMMPDVVKMEMEDDKVKRPSLFRHKWLGEPYGTERKIYSDWEVVEKIPHEARLERYGLNFGYTGHPAAIVAVYYYNGGYIIDEIAYGSGMMNRVLADTILSQEKKSLVIADSAEPKSIDEIKEFGVNIVPANKGSDSVRHGISLVQDQQVSITKRSMNVRREQMNYMWKTDKNGMIIYEPEEPYHYSMDAVRYAITSLVPVKRREELIRNLPRIETKKQKNPAL